MKKFLCLFLLLILICLLCACDSSNDKYQTGYYTAELADFDDHGWKEFVTIYVRDGKIVTIEYNAKNSSGFIKSWDMSYMAAMNAQTGTYPNQYTRFFAGRLLNGQGDGQIDALSGASHSHHTFQLLAEAVLEQAKAGRSDVALVPVPKE